jgi:predicted phosphodiesterase
VITWRTDVASSGAVEYGPGDFASHVVSDGPRTEHSLALTGLMPGETYTYRIRANGVVATEGHAFKTPPPPGEAWFKFVVFGDSGTGSAAQFEVARLIEKLEPDFFLHTGDVIYESGEARHYDPRFFAPYAVTLREAPIYPTIGNHDVGGIKAAAYLEAFHLPSNNSERSEWYYSFHYGNAHFIALYAKPGDPSQYAPGTPQYEWLNEELRNSTARWKFVYFHPAPYVSSLRGSDLPSRQVLSPLFETYAVDVVFTGHEHLYERTLPRLDFVPGGSAVTYIVTGGGGARLTRAGRSDFTAYSESAYHVVEVRVMGDVLVAQAIRVDGVVMDTFARQKPADDPYR